MTDGLVRTALVALVLLAGGVAGCDKGDSAPAGTAGGAAAPAPAGGGAALDADAVKQFITRQEERLATGVGSSHQSVKVEFVDVRLGEPRKPNEQDKIDGVRGDTVYPVRAKYKSLRRWGNGDTAEKEIHYGYDFYRDEFGEWNAVLRGPVR